MPETILAFDFGLRRIGVAVGQQVTGSANPLGVVNNGAGGPDWDRISQILNEWRPAMIVVGMPSHTDGRRSGFSKEVNRFIKALGRYQLAVDTVDERYTSIEAESRLKSERAAGLRGRIRKETIDSTAAVLIAERWLRNQDRAR